MMCRLPDHLFYVDGAENQVETLFVMESPHTEELQDDAGFPCVGNTGRNMTAKICPGEIQSFGILIKDGNNELARKYALFETFKFPLGLDLFEGLNEHELFWKKIKIIDSRHYENRFDHYDSLCNFFHQNIAIFPETYQRRFEYAVQIFNNLKEIVVCGFIAQAIFRETFHILDPGYCIRTPILFLNKNLDLYFVRHPAHTTVWPYVVR